MTSRRSRADALRRLVMLPLAAAAMGLAAPAQADYYALLIGQTTNLRIAAPNGQGTPHQDLFRDNVNGVQAGLTGGSWAGYAKAGHTVALAGGAANDASVTAALAGLNALMAGDADARLFIYFAGHGGSANLGNPETSLTPVDEYLLFDDTGGAGRAQGIWDDSFGRVKLANVKHTLFFIDACFGGGMWNGGDEGDFNRVGSSALIASARENQKAPLHSAQTPLLVNLLNAGRPGQLINAVGIANRTVIDTFFTGPRRDDIPIGPGDSFSEVLTDLTQVQSAYFSSGSEIDQTTFLQAVPEPPAWLLLGLGAGAFALRRRRG